MANGSNKPTEDIKKHDLLIGFEGTGSQMWGTTDWIYGPLGTRSFIKRCVDRATEPDFAKYMAGPDAGGRELGNILSDAKNFYDIKKMQTDRIGEGLRVSLVGYSRGGHIAICLARMLQLEGVKVKFLGLFDAVARDFTGAMPKEYRTDKIPTNVSVCYHAVRRANHSRQWFSNTGVKSKDRELMEFLSEAADVGLKAESLGFTGFKLETFPGTHAALGGFPMDTPEKHPTKGFVNVSNKPYIVQGYAEKIYPGIDIKPLQERETWMGAAKFISEPLVNYNIIKRQILE